jgi:hypothetical protein
MLEAAMLFEDVKRPHFCKEQGAFVIENDAERESVAFRTA